MLKQFDVHHSWWPLHCLDACWAYWTIQIAEVCQFKLHVQGHAPRSQATVEQIGAGFEKIDAFGQGHTVHGDRHLVVNELVTSSYEDVPCQER